MLWPSGEERYVVNGHHAEAVGNDGPQDRRSACGTPLFLDKAGAFSYTSSAVRQQCLGILADGGASVPLDQPEVGRITVPFLKPD